tara:strand:- start:8099 stop:8530 length:432 start_codon:yes stop_codon:yes gene_type:complete
MFGLKKKNKKNASSGLSEGDLIALNALQEILNKQYVPGNDLRGYQNPNPRLVTSSSADDWENQLHNIINIYKLGTEDGYRFYPAFGRGEGPNRQLFADHIVGQDVYNRAPADSLSTALVEQLLNINMREEGHSELFPPEYTVK